MRRMMRALQHANFTFAKKISHTADTRPAPSHGPGLASAAHIGGHALTGLCDAHVDCRKRARKGSFARAMADAWNAKNELLDRGAPREVALYLLPNAKAIRLVETGSLLHLLTNGPCAPASTRRRKFTTPRWMNCSSCTPPRPNWRDISARRAISRRNRDADLHGGIAFLWCEGLGKFPEHRAEDLRRV